MIFDWIPTVLALKNPFDYDEYVKSCIVKEVSPIYFFEYAQRVGLLFFALKRYGDTDPVKSYMALQQEHLSNKGGCKGCGQK